jgi:hypothetical protein
MNHPTEEKFLNDVKNHTMKVLLDESGYRHLEFSDGTFNQRFEIITSPNLLTYTGDMGTYVFQRTHDMFNFFRSQSDSLIINSGYWAEKCIAEDSQIKMKEWDVDAFREQVKEFVWNHCESELGDQEHFELTEELIEEHELWGLMRAEDEWDCIAAYRDYSGYIDLSDFFDGFSGMRKTYHYIWALYAIVWAIKQYDDLKKGQ